MVSLGFESAKPLKFKPHVPHLAHGARTVHRPVIARRRLHRHVQARSGLAHEWRDALAGTAQGGQARLRAAVHGVQASRQCG
jgi:hypothetical protein